MCFDYDSRPPELPADLVCRPIAGGAAAELLALESDDGTSFSAALAQAPEGVEPGVVIIPDVRGLYPFYIELAERFAEAGHHATTTGGPPASARGTTSSTMDRTASR